jgi:hypothetical protein
MMMLAVITFLAGALLGMRFKCLVLVPALAFVVAAILFGGVAHSEDGGSTALAIVIASIGLQVGYLGGLFTIHAAVLMRAARIRKAVPHARRAVSGHAH